MDISKKTNRTSFIISMIIYVTALLVYSVWNNFYQENKILDQIDTKLYNSAISLKYLLPDDFHDRAIDAQSISIAEDRYIARKLTALVQKAGFKYSYTIIKKGDKLFFVASDVMADPENKRGTFYFQEYKDADQSFIDAFAKETPTYKTVTDQWGEVRTVMVPETSPGGTQYIACVDYDISYVQGLLQENLLHSFVIALFFLLLALPIIKIYTKSDRELIKKLQESESYHKTLFENNTSCILLIDPESSDIVDANPAACSFYGYSRDTITQMNILDINVMPREELQKEHVKLQAHQQNYFNFSHRLADNSIKDVEVYSDSIQVGGKSLFCSTIHDISARNILEKEREQLIQDLESALSEIKTLRGIVPICSQCKKIRDGSGYWNRVEEYVEKHSDASFSHSLCPDCSDALYGQEEWYREMKEK